ncbi:hypothetical protein HK104_008482 [Borealophlyctis nickersoniae]|nr:hypothetical protein HK104_008482 [Borealophlyctis nickersoniae]
MRVWLVLNWLLIGRIRRSAPASSISRSFATLAQEQPLSEPAVKPKLTSAGLQLAKTLDEVAALQVAIGEDDPAWVRRVSRELVDLDGPFRVAVVGETSVGTSTLISSLVENALAEHTIAKSMGAGTSSQVYRITHGDKLTEEVDTTSGDVHHIQCPTEWAIIIGKEVNPSITALQTFDKDPTILANVIYRSDLVVLLTDASRLLSGAWETAFIRDFVAKGKKNVIIAVNKGGDLEDPRSNAVSIVQNRLQTLLPSAPSSSLPAVFPISIQSTRGLMDLRSTIIARLDTPADRSLHKTEAAVFTARQAVERLLNAENRADAAIKGTRSEISSLVESVVATEKRLLRDFRLRDLAIVEYGVTSLSDAITAYFEKVRFWRLFWRSDFVAEDLKATMKENSLLQAEYQMTYAVGKLNEGLHGARERIRSYLASLTSATHPLATEPLTRPLQKEAAAALEALDRQHSPSAREVDPFVLRNEVATFDETRQCDVLQRHAEKLVRNQLGFQLAVYPIGLLLTHLGVPWGISIPSTLFVSALGLAWMKTRWGTYEDELWSKISQAHKKLKDRLTTVYEKELSRVGAEPLAASLKMFEEGLGARELNIAARRKDTEEVLKRLDELSRRG